jgi:hypothetical protein
MALGRAFIVGSSWHSGIVLCTLLLSKARPFYQRTRPCSVSSLIGILSPSNTIYSVFFTADPSLTALRKMGIHRDLKITETGYPISL